jgi:hypothetical protein
VIASLAQISFSDLLEWNERETQKLGIQNDYFCFQTRYLGASPPMLPVGDLHSVTIQRKDAPRVSKFISSLENGGLAKSLFFSLCSSLRRSKLANACQIRQLSRSFSEQPRLRPS